MLLELFALALLFSVHATGLKERDNSQRDIIHDSPWADGAQASSVGKSLHSEKNGIKSARDVLAAFLQGPNINAQHARKRRSKDSDQATYGFNVPAGDKLRISFLKPGEDNVPHQLQKELLLLQKEVMRQVSERDNVTSLVRMLLSKMDVLETRERDNTEKHSSEIKHLRNDTRKLHELNENLSGEVDALRKLNRAQNNKHERELSMLREEKQKLWLYTQSLERELNVTGTMLMRNNESVNARLINLDTLNNEQHNSHSELIKNLQSKHESLLKNSQQFMVDTTAKMKNFETLHDKNERAVEKLEYLVNNKFKDISDKVDDLKLQDQRLMNKDATLEDQTVVILRNVEKLFDFRDRISNNLLTVNMSLNELKSKVSREVDAIYSKEETNHETQRIELNRLKSRVERVENKADDLQGIDNELVNDIDEIEEKLTNSLDKSSQVLKTIDEHTVDLDVLKTSIDTLSNVFQSQTETVLAHYEHITGINASLKSYEKTFEMFKQGLSSATKKFSDLQFTTEKHRTKFAEILSKIEDHGQIFTGHQQNIKKVQNAVLEHQNIFTDMGKTLQNLNHTLINALEDVTSADSTFSSFNDSFYELLSNQIKLSNDFESLQLKQQDLEANQDVTIRDFKFELAAVVRNTSRNYLSSVKANQAVVECQQKQLEASNTMRYLGTTVQNIQANVSALYHVGTRLNKIEKQLLASIQNVSDNFNFLETRVDESDNKTQMDIKLLNQTILSLTKIGVAKRSSFTSNDPAVNTRAATHTAQSVVTETIIEEHENPVEESEGEFILPTKEIALHQSTASATTTAATSPTFLSTITKMYTETQKTTRPVTLLTVLKTTTAPSLTPLTTITKKHTERQKTLRPVTLPTVSASTTAPSLTSSSTTRPVTTPTFSATTAAPSLTSLSTIRPVTEPTGMHYENSTWYDSVTLSNTSDIGDPEKETQTSSEIRFSVTEDDLAGLITMSPTASHVSLGDSNVPPPTTITDEIINDTTTLGSQLTTDDGGSGDEDTNFPNSEFTEYLSWPNVTTTSRNLNFTEKTPELNISADFTTNSLNTSISTPSSPITEESVKRTACPKRLATVIGSKVLTELRKIQGNSYSTGAWFKDSSDGNSFWVMPGHSRVDRVFKYESEIALRENMLPRDTFILPINCAGTGHVVFQNSVFCSLFKQPVIVKYNLTDGTLSKLRLTDAGVDNSYSYSIGGWTAIDFAVDEHGLWVIYPSVSRNGTIVIGKMNEYSFSLENTWHTSQKKNTELNAFMICGTLYTVSQKFISPSAAPEAPYIHYTFSTSTGEEQVYSPGNIQLSDFPYYTVMMDYSPSDEMLYSWIADATYSQLLTYQLNFTSLVDMESSTASIGKTTETASDSTLGFMNPA